MNSLQETLVLVFAMGAVILFCRAFPFLAMKGEKQSSPLKDSFLNFVEKTVPPAAMTVLAFNILGSSFRESPIDGLPALAASILTALLHIWKKNSLISIFGGTALYMILTRIIL